MKVIAYLRVSTHQQMDSNLSFAAQKMECEDYAKKLGATIDMDFRDEALSGALPLEKRPGMLNALANLQKGDILIVAKRDRLGRDPLVVAMIESAIVRKGAKVLSAAGEGTESDDPSSVLMRRMVDAFGEYERLITKARTKAALQAKKLRGERVGYIPFGHKLASNGIHLQLCDREQEILQQIKSLRQSGKSLRAIAKEMNQKGAFNRNASPWNHGSMHRLLSNKT